MANIKSRFSAIFYNKESVGIVRNPLRLFWLRVVLVVTFILSVLFSFYAGEYWTTFVAKERDGLLDEVAELTRTLQGSEASLKAIKLDSELAQIAVNDVRQENLMLQERVAGLEAEVKHYQRVMNPIRNDKGLRIDTVEITSTADAKRYRINLVLTQLGRQNRSVILGSVKGVIVGSLNGVKTEYDIKKLNLADSDLVERFRFRYYQELSWELELVEGFVPEQLKIMAKSKGKKAMVQNKIMEWQLVDQ